MSDKKKIAEAEGVLEGLKQAEVTAQGALDTAKELAKEAKGEAKKQAEADVKDAEEALAAAGEAVKKAEADLKAAKAEAKKNLPPYVVADGHAIAGTKVRGPGDPISADDFDSKGDFDAFVKSGHIVKTK